MAAAAATLPPNAIAVRRDLPIALPVATGLPIAPAPPLAVAKTIGPLPGIIGPVHIDLHLPAATIAIVHPSFTAPLIVATRGELPVLHAAPTALPLDGGSVWILARALAPDAPADAYVGLTVASGSVTFAHPTTATADTITLTGALDLVLVAVPSDPRAHTAGAHAAIRAPARLEIHWAAGVATATAGAGAATIYGAAFELAAPAAAAPLRYDAGLAGLALAFGAAAHAFDATTVTSRLARFDGGGAVTASWLFPLNHPADPRHPAEAASPGMWDLAIADGVRARWLGETTAATLGGLHVIADGDRAVLTTPRASTPTPRRTLTMFGDAGHATPLVLEVADAFAFAFATAPTTGDLLGLAMSARVANAQPIDVAGEPLGVGTVDHALVTLAQEPTATAPIAIRVLGARTPMPGRTTLALHNALLAVSRPAGFALAGLTADGRTVDGAELRVVLGCYGWVPTLPDPYVTSGRATNGIFNGTAGTAHTIQARLSRGPSGGIAIAFEGVIGDPTVDVGAPGAPTPVQPTAQRHAVPTQIAQGRAAPIIVRAPSLTHLDPQLPPVAAGAKPALLAAAEARAALGAAIAKVAPLPPNPVRLLDVSGAQDLAGVAIGVPAALPGVAIVPAVFALDASTVTTALSNTALFLLPQVQWEPVRTLDVDQLPDGLFPPRLDFLGDGGPTTIGVNQATLVPVVPDRVVDAVLAAFAAAAPVAVVTTLPFGLGAALALRPERRDVLARHAPAFPDRGLDGAFQLTARAATPARAGQSPAFDGRVAVTPGLGAIGSTWHVVGPLAALDAAGHVEPDSAQAFVATEFASFVPLGRIELSGRGESTFSEWTDPAALASVGSARFRVLVGRTALEVVKIVSVMHPWGIIVTRTVTIERLGGGGVVRRDTGWQAASNGVFRFPGAPGITAPVYPFRVEPGLVRGLYAVRDIRDAGGRAVQFTGSQGATTLAPKRFSALLRVDGHADPIPADDVLGFLQVLPEQASLAPADLDALFSLLRDPDTGDGGAIGGRIDAELDVNGSGLRFRARRFEVEWAGAALVGTVRGSPIVKAGGAWGMARRTRDVTTGPSEATTVEAARGTPLVRPGDLDQSHSTADAIVAPAGPVLVRDPADLHAATGATQVEYGLLQSSPAHALFFPDPSVPGAGRITVASPPELADVFLRATSKGVFPDAAHALVLGRTDLAVAADGSLSPLTALAWTRPTPDFALPLADDGSRVLDLRDASVSVAFDASTWSVAMPGLAIWNDVLGMSRVLGFTYDLRAANDRRPALENALTAFGGGLSDQIRSVAKWFLPPALPRTVELAASNAFVETEIEFGLHVTLPDVISDSSGSFGDHAPEAESSESPISVTLEAGTKVSFDSRGGPPGWSVFVGLEVEGKIPLTPIVSLLIRGSFEYEKGGTNEDELEIRVWVGFELGIDHEFKIEFTTKLGAILRISISPTGTAEWGLGFTLGIAFEMSITEHFPLVVLGIEGEVACVFYPSVSSWGAFVLDVSRAVAGSTLALDIGRPSIAPTRVTVAPPAGSDAAAIARAVADAIAAAGITGITAEPGDHEVKIDNDPGDLTVAVVSGALSVARDEGAIHLASGTLTDLGTELDSFTTNGSYALGWWRGVIHADVLFIFSISVEWEYLFSCHT